MVLLNLIRNLDPVKYDIYLLPVYEFNKEFAEPIIDKVSLLKGLNFYFRGLDKLMDRIPGALLYNYFIRDKYDLVIAFQFGISTRMVSMGHQINRICWMHTYDTEMLQRRYYKRFRKIITVAKIGRDKLVKDGFSEDMTDYCYNIIDETRIYELAKEDLDFVKSERIIVTTVARLNPDKACMRYLECIKEILQKFNNVEFWVIGDGVEYPKMEAFIKANMLQENVRLLGMQKNPYKYMARSDLYFCASYREGFSTSCQEAAILGIPVVSVEVDGARELIEIAECGMVIPNEKDAITTELRRILCDEQRLSDWKKTANVTKKRFYKQERIKKAESILDDVL